MSENAEIEKIEKQVEALPNPETMNILQTLIKSGKLPSHIKTVEDAFLIKKFGEELRVPFLQAAHYIFPINGRLTLSTAGMSALLRRGGVKWKTTKDAEKVTNAEGAVTDLITTIVFYRDGIEEESTFTYKEAQKAGLVTKDVWKFYTKAMLWARAFAQGARRIGSDLLMGLIYTTEELDEKGAISYDSEGNPVIKN